VGGKKNLHANQKNNRTSLIRAPSSSRKDEGEYSVVRVEGDVAGRTPCGGFLYGTESNSKTAEANSRGHFGGKGRNYFRGRPGVKLLGRGLQKNTWGKDKTDHKKAPAGEKG